jgi:hypothetical protein
MTMTKGECLDLAMRMNAKSDQRIIDAETAQREGRHNAAFELLGEAQGWVDASRMVLLEAAS